jgi:glycine cleavage system aminomethyltransferase T
VLEAGMPWIAKLDKDDFVGKWALQHVLKRGERERLVGFVMESRVVAPEGGQIVRDGEIAGRVTSARWSEAANASIGMAWVPPDLAHDGAEIDIRVGERLERAMVRLSPFYDPEGALLRA